MKIAEAISEGGLHTIKTTGKLVAATVQLDGNGDDVREVTGQVIDQVTEYDQRICSHSGNCPCAARPRTLRNEVIVWSDGSVSLADDAEEHWANDEDDIDDVLIERELASL